MTALGLGKVKGLKEHEGGGHFHFFIHILICIGKLEWSVVQHEAAVAAQLHGEAPRGSGGESPDQSGLHGPLCFGLGGRKEGIMSGDCQRGKGLWCHFD